MSKIAKIVVELARMKHTINYEVVQAWFVGECDACHGHGAIFYTIEDHAAIDEYNNVEGGFYCQDCGFSNAGRCHTDYLPGYRY